MTSRCKLSLMVKQALTGFRAQHRASETTDILANRLNLKFYAHRVNIQILSA